MLYVNSVENGRKSKNVDNVNSVNNFSEGLSRYPHRGASETDFGKESADLQCFREADSCPSGYTLLNGKTTYYVCKNQTCFPPSNQIPE